jgi:hypothetical protein
VVVSCDVLPDSDRAGRTVEPEGPLERSAALRQRETLGIGMQVRTPATRCASWVGEQGSFDRDDAQQF